MKFSERDFIKYGNKKMYGRIVSYDRRKGYGFIHTELGNDIFISSYDISDKEDKYSVGVTVEFIPTKRNDNYFASNVKIIKRHEKGEQFLLPNGKSLYKKDIIDIKFIPGKNFLERNLALKEAMKKREISSRLLDHVSFLTKNTDEYKIFSKETILDDSYIKVADLDKYWEDVKKELIYMY